LLNQLTAQSQSLPAVLAQQVPLAMSRGTESKSGGSLKKILMGAQELNLQPSD
jgi:hypothetical protein